ncbi:MAG TPA: hypothetical protein VG347_23495 [Verrucomicrobiae bacterium]|nr:hypothetical protein [Verrucomicrobiae bacterium]
MMNHSQSPRISPGSFPAARWFYAALLAAVLFSTGVAHAAVIEQRWLLIFNTSSGMKKRLPAVETQIATLLTKDFARDLREGDSVGVWTFNDKLSMGKYPLINWDPKRSWLMISNLTTFVRKQDYTGVSSLATLQPTLDSVIEDSDRLTVVIVCDGDGDFQWTPYNEGMNETLKQTREDRKKLKLPYVIILRTQMGKYVGATVNFPPLAANLPPFPLLPSEIKALAPPPVVVKPPPPAPITPPLVIVGTHVSSDTNDLVKYAVTNAAPVVVEKPAVVTPEPPVPQNVAQTAPVVAAPAVAPTAPVTPVAPKAQENVIATTNARIGTNEVVAVTIVDDRDTRILTYVGVGLLGAAVVLVIFLITRGRSTPRSSLITSSMQSDPRPPEQK